MQEVFEKGSSAAASSDARAHVRALAERARSHAAWQEPIFQELREGRVTPDELRSLLVQYFYYVERFVSRLCAVMARAPEEYARLALATNVYEEMGAEQGIKATHLSLIRDVLRDTGAEPLLNSQPPLPTTRIAEMYFQGTCVDGSVWDAFYAMGPGTEAVSQFFLDPMEIAVEKVFGKPKGTVDYFVVHYPETDMAHAEAIQEAIVSHLEDISDVGQRKAAMLRGQGIVDASIAAHALLFNGVWKQWRYETTSIQIAHA